MSKMGCFSRLLSIKKKPKDAPRPIDARKVSAESSPWVKPEELPAAESNELLMEAGDPKAIVLHARSIMNDGLVSSEAAYEGGDEQDARVSLKRVISDFDLDVKGEGKDGEYYYDSVLSNYQMNDSGADMKSDRDEKFTPEMIIPSGHLSDPGIPRKARTWEVPILKRSCSNIETKWSSTKFVDSPKKSCSYHDLHNILQSNAYVAQEGGAISPLSAKTSCSADKVMLKKRSSSQVLPSRSRKLWWRLFMWSHRNALNSSWLNMPQRLMSANDASRKQSGYASDTIEASEVETVDRKKKKVVEEPQNQWVSFSVEDASVNRVDAWVHSLEDDYFYPSDQEGVGLEEVGLASKYPSTMERGESSGKNGSQVKKRASDEIVKANAIIQSLNTLSSVAHISGMGIKVIPAISAYNSLRTVNLSNNFIVQISASSLPKSLHCLDLSRNKIVSIEGLRELTRLRVLNLSYNKISRIGQGLSNCTGIKELYIAGNKISYVEGLHRLLKLTVLDLSFNKITTTKALGQLVANYHSLLALNLLGNPIQSNIGDEQLRKAVSGLLPQLKYLNKQPVKPQRAREAATDSITRAALGDNGWSSRRRATKRVSGASTAEGSSHRSSRNKLRSRR